MYKTIFVGTINRSGGSLLMRLFDGHPKILSYPTEVGFPFNKGLYPIFESYAGIPMTVPSYEGRNGKDAYDLLEIPRQKPAVMLKWGRERMDPVGVRKNYLEKVFYGTISTDFDFDKFIRLFDKYRRDAESISQLYDARHRAYFEAWDNGRYMQDPEYVVMHDSGGFYLTNIDRFFAEFRDSTFVHPIRDVMGYIASEKTRLARRYYGSRRFSYPRFPNFLVKTFKDYDLEAQIRAWIVAVTRAVLLQEKYGRHGRFIVYRNERLLEDTEAVMRALCAGIGLEFFPVLFEPTIAGKPWSGSSHQGRQKGINKNLATYYPEVLAASEIERIEKATGPIRSYLNAQIDTPPDLSNLPKKTLGDYDYQKRYFDDEEKISLYYALVNSGRRRVMVKAPGFSAIPAHLYAKMVQIIHIPRMLKLRFFPGWGKQNYT